MASILNVRDLVVNYGDYQAVSGVSLEVESGYFVMLVGESGSGKSTLIRSILGLLGSGGTITHGDIRFEGVPMPIGDEKKMQTIRGNEISIILQNPDLFLNPLIPIEAQYCETLMAHGQTNRIKAHEQAIATLSRLGFEFPERILKMYPFELSGGMCQRAAVAIAMANHPRLLLADEPTSALDVSAQEDVMALLKSIQKNYGTTILLVTHNMSIVSRYADEVGVMYQGKLVEWGSCKEVLRDPRHEYTKMLLSAVPQLNGQPSVFKRPIWDESISYSAMKYVSDRHCYLSLQKD